MVLINPDLDPSWVARHPLHVAWDLVGAVLTVRFDGVDCSGRIVEAEAYGGPEDLASHAGKLRTGRETLFGEVGRWYMYRSYGIHTLANIVAHGPGRAGAVLLRAVEPISGTDTIRDRRGRELPFPLRGPGALCQGLAIQLSATGTSIAECAETSLEIGETSAMALVATSRIGISKGLTAHWRLFEADNRHVSASRRGSLVHRETLDMLIPPVGTIID